MKKIVLILSLLMSAILITLFISFSEVPQKEAFKKEDLNATMINIHGTSDKRLKLFFKATYRPVYIPRRGSLPEECLNSNINLTTGTKKPRLKFEGISIEGKDEYNITIPVFNKDLRSKCTYEFAGISVRVRRMYDDVLYSKIPILTDTPFFIPQGTRSGISSGGKGTYIKKPKYKHYFRIPDDTKVSCFTKFYERDGKSNAHATFMCELNHREINSEIEKVVDESIKLDIDVDENLSVYVPKYNRHKYRSLSQKEKDNYIKKFPFQEKSTPVHIKIKNLFIGE